MNFNALKYTDRSVDCSGDFIPGFSRRTAAMGASAIREILKTAAQPGVISLAGGLPAREALPMDLIGHLVAEALARFGSGACQYSPSEGFGPLREALARHLSSCALTAVAPEAVIITSGAQGALDALGKILISPGDRVAVEAPTYLGALQAFSPYGPTYVRLATDDQGVIPESLDQAIRRDGARLVYLVPTFQNPTGRTLSDSRRRAIADILNASDALLIEDDPYRELRFSGAPLTPIQRLAPDRVIYIGSFSKILSPGLRLGYMVASEPIRRWAVIARQGTDLHAGTLAQAVAAVFLDRGYLPAHLARIIDLYYCRYQALAQALADIMPETYSWTCPEGGMFLWVTGPDGFDAQDLYRRALDLGTAIVPGHHFFAWPGEGRHTFRLNFTGTDPKHLGHATKALGKAIRSVTLLS